MAFARGNTTRVAKKLQTKGYLMTKVLQPFPFLLASLLLFTISFAVYAGVDKEDSEAFIALQACLDIAVDVPDGGSYAEYCINKYIAERDSAYSE